MIAEPFDRQAELEQKTARFNEVMAILNPKEEQIIGDTEDDGEEIQYQARSYLDEDEQRKYSKKQRYNETETLFMQWENGSAPVGEVRQFVRFQKYHYYEKTAEGCVEITAAEYAAKKGRDIYADDRQANDSVVRATYSYESAKARETGNSGVNGNDGNAGFVSRQAIVEELRNDAGGSLRGSNRNISGISDGISEDTQEQQRTTPLGDREVLSIATNDITVEDLEFFRRILNIEKRIASGSPLLLYSGNHIPGRRCIAYTKTDTEV